MTRAAKNMQEFIDRFTEIGQWGENVTGTSV
jgi:hypothetical protein